VVAAAIAATVAVPLVVVLASWLDPAGDVWRHLWQTQLVELLANRLLLAAGVGVGTLVLGAALAWLVVAYEFPGRRLFEWLLIVPLAMPAYVIGFAFLALFDYGGPVQTLLRRLVGPGATLPELRAGWGVVVMMTLVFYPYVYVVARVAFREHGGAALEVARSLGHSPARAFIAVILPLARPALAAGAALAMMEALADFGTVSIFGYRTLTEAVYRVWTGMFDRVAATQVASVLLVLALGLLALERWLRGRRRFTGAAGRRAALPRVRLRGVPAAAATAACTAVLALAFVLPVAELIVWAWEVEPAQRATRGFAGLVGSTFLLAGASAVLVGALALVLAYARRLRPSPTATLAAQFASMGYALPGAVIAVGVLAPVAWLDGVLAAVADAVLDRPVGLLLTGSAAAVLFAYAVRFLAVGYQTTEAALARIPPTLDEAARSLGVTMRTALRRIHVPLMRGGMLSTLILIWVETIKELPATLLLRPFGMKTLAIEVWERTSESLWAEAALPALAIVAVGLLPLVLITRLERGRS
jgi:iron(III) transport system permease protein